MALVGKTGRSRNITILLLPPKSPELNPVENIWQFMRDNGLSNRVFQSYDDLVDHCCDAWNKLPLEDRVHRIAPMGVQILIGLHREPINRQIFRGGTSFSQTCRTPGTPQQSVDYSPR